MPDRALGRRLAIVGGLLQRLFRYFLTIALYPQKDPNPQIKLEIPEFLDL